MSTSSCYFYPRYLGRDQETIWTQVTFLNSTMEAVGINSLQKRAQLSVTLPDWQQFYGQAFGTRHKAFNNWNTHCWSNITGWKVVVAVAWREREAQGDVYWRLISIETPLLHRRRCRTDDLHDVIPCLPRSVQHYAKRTAASAIYRTWMLTTRVGCISCIRASIRRFTAAFRKSGVSIWKTSICEGTQRLVASKHPPTLRLFIQNTVVSF